MKKALSILQPWAWLIVNGHKDIENRTWNTEFRGEFLVHAGKGFDADAYDDMRSGALRLIVPSYLPKREHFERGGIVGQARIADCVIESPSRWFFGPYGFVLADAKPLPFRPLRWQLMFFSVPD